MRLLLLCHLPSMLENEMFGTTPTQTWPYW
jgi:hypothetical protein